MTETHIAERRKRRSIRLRDYDYTQDGAYFVTICTAGRVCRFGEIVDDEMHANDQGTIAMACWQAIPEHCCSVSLGEFVIMPNHVHGIIVIDTPDTGTRPVVGAQHAAPLHAPLPQAFTAPHVTPGSLGAIVRAYKSAVTRQINALNRTPGAPIWQRNTYEHIIRNERALNAIRDYIWYNPARWALDRDNPDTCDPPFTGRQPTP